uniref:NOC3-like DNA replication regulator n=1 Tax=Cyprinus carpio TaxID=7962 RepID=A0A8C2L2L9_CYPCA
MMMMMMIFYQRRNQRATPQEQLHLLCMKEFTVKKETLQLREFEEDLVCQYKFYLEDLEQTIKDWKQKRSQAVSLQKGLAEVAIKCICVLLVALPHFSFQQGQSQDKLGQASLAVVKVISGMVKGRNYNVLNCLLCLRKKEVEMKKDAAPKKKLMSCEEKRTHLSRMQQKWKKAEEKLQKELLEAEASESKEKMIKLHTETLKKAQKPILLPSVLEGLAKFAHLINLEFLDDLLVLYGLITSGDLTYRKSLHCILTSSQDKVSDVLNIDPLKFYNHLYITLLTLHAGEISSFPKCIYLNRFKVKIHRLSHFHPVVRKFAAHLMKGAPSEGSGALSMELSRKTPVQLFEDYSVKDMSFNPSVSGPPSKKKEHFTIGDAFLDSELKTQIDAALQNASERADESRLHITAGNQ